MPVASPDVPEKAQRAIPLIPAIIALILVVAAAAFAFSHFTAKKPAPQLDSTTAEVATGQTPETRDAYNAGDFTEPDKK